MPSLHLDIPSIDWIDRSPRTDRSDRGKAAPVPDAPMPKERAKRAASGDTPGLDPWPGRPAGLPA